MAAVAVVKTSMSGVREGLKRALDSIGYAPSKEAIFIKPNLVRPFPPYRGITTHPAVVKAFISLYPNHRFVIGDGTPVPGDYRRVLRVCGFSSIAGKHSNVRIVNLDDVPREPVRCGEKTLRLPVLLRTHEYVNIAKMKTHSQTYVSLAVKNQKGLLLLADKKNFHKADLHAPIMQLGESVRPALNIVEGLVALEGNGPSFFGKAKRLGAIIAGKDAFAVDAACCRVMRLDIRAARHLKPDVSFEAVGDGIKSVRTRFAPPGDRWSIGRMRVYFDEHCCSICLSNLPVLSRKIIRHPLKLAKLAYHAAMGDIALVGGNTLPPEAKGKRITFLGECGRRCAQDAGMARDARIVGGCPFRPDELLKLL